ncbi:o-superfamily protein [Penicillium angulare]|uniref:o-superfamily protein n=1 Tax=Penicillium angulare TaxID=116970 RepID=UPI0025410B2A|nr:o-superfamily protein [Penicillium angulare]KAJ5266447.1 o-superfamily protein [Penicillium angulare]
MKFFSVALAALFAAVAVAGPVELEKRCAASGEICSTASNCCSGACAKGPVGAPRSSNIGKCG